RAHPVRRRRGRGNLAPLQRREPLMADQPSAERPTNRRRGVWLGIAAAVVIALGAALWYWLSGGREAPDDAQIDAHILQTAARVGGTVVRVAVTDNQLVEAGTVLVELDPRDYEVAIQKARAELADADGAAIAAANSVPITSTQTTGSVATARGSVEQA